MKYEERERCGAVLIDTCTQVFLPRLGTPSMAASFPSPYPRHRVVPSQLTLLVFTYALTLSLKDITARLCVICWPIQVLVLLI